MAVLQNYREYWFFGDKIRVHCNQEWVLSQLDLDFAQASDSSTLPQVVNQAQKIYDLVLECRQGEGKYLPFNYYFKGVRRLGWGSQLTSRYEDGCEISQNEVQKTALIRAEDPKVLWSRAYYFILSRVGEWQDLQGRHRIHALGAKIGGKAVLFTGPSGSGKSTLAASLLSHVKDVELYSDEMPFVDQFARVYPFAVRISLKPDSLAGLLLDSERDLRQDRFGKFLWNPTNLKLASPSPVAMIFELSPKRDFRPSYRPSLPWERPMVIGKNLVVGSGIPQMAEHFIRWDGTSGNWRLLKILQSRVQCMGSALKNVPMARLTLGASPVQNAQYISQVIGQLDT